MYDIYSDHDFIVCSEKCIDKKRLNKKIQTNEDKCFHYCMDARSELAFETLSVMNKYFIALKDQN